MEDILRVDLENKKYTVVLTKDHHLKALRYGEEWRDCCGDNLIFYLAQEVQDLRDKIENAKNCLVCAPIADPSEVINNTFLILEG